MEIVTITWYRCVQFCNFEMRFFGFKKIMACVTETKTATCRCGLVDQKRFRGSLHVKCCNEEHLKNALENPCALTMNFNDELNEKNLATTNEWCEFCVSWQPTMVSGFFPSQHEKNRLLFERENIVMRVCRWAVVQLSLISLSQSASVRTQFIPHWRGKKPSSS